MSGIGQLGTFGNSIQAYDQASGAGLPVTDPWTAPGWTSGNYQDPTSQAAYNFWATNLNGGQIPDYGNAPNDNSELLNPYTPVPAAATNTPNAAATAGGYNPLQPAYVSPTTLSQGQIDSLSPNQTIGALTAANGPQFQQQDQQMMQMLATAGLAPSSTAGQTAFNNLAQQQLAGMDPSIASAIQNSQGNLLNAGQFNATTANTGAQNNANAFNTAGNNYFNAETGAYNGNANAFNALNSAGLAGGQNLASGQQSGGNQLASGQQGNFPVYSNPFSSVSAGQIGSAGQYPQPTTTNNYYPAPGADAGYTSYTPTGAPGSIDG